MLTEIIISMFIQPLPVRMLRNVINRFWGGGQQEPNESSDDEEEDAHSSAHEDDVD